MNRKISWGIFIVIFALFYLLEIRFPGLMYDLKREISNLVSFRFFRIEFIILAVGILFLIRRRIVLGLIFIYIAGRMIFHYSEYFLPLFIMFVGLVYIFLGINEKNGGKNKNG